MNDAPALEARVVRLDARGCLVRFDEPAPGRPEDERDLWCSVRGRIHLRDRTGQKSPVVVGDRVQVVRTAEEKGSVVKVHPRESTLSRPAVRRGRVEHVMAANVDQVVVVGSAADPPFNPGLVDRVLAVAEYSRLDAVVVVNKMDLVDDAPAETETYLTLDIPVLPTSAETGFGLDALREVLEGRASVITGHSGVGKTSLLNALEPGLGLTVGDVNVVTGRGTHTTTAAVWIPFGDGAVVDTAGVREFGLFGIPKRDVPWLFQDIAEIAPGCRFPDCLHLEEPGCAVHGALEDGRLALFRYESYLSILDGLDEIRD